ncbi:hypothetical protein [Vibrio litoralis]|uniref:hypothetical protein n=1 Tax=Vibrio litoralis TaxID=335972 RepID=UPI0004839BFE|nr:hypothetical protein [Vibrio litoralis]
MKWILILCSVLSFNALAIYSDDEIYKALGIEPPTPEIKELDRLGSELLKGSSEFLKKSESTGSCKINLKLVNGRYKGKAIEGSKATCDRVKFYFENLELDDDILNNKQMGNIKIIVSGEEPKSRVYIK